MTNQKKTSISPKEFDAIKIKKQFPIFERKINGEDLVYLDNGATTQKPERVIKALSDYYRNYNSNVHRGLHTLSMEASEAYEKAHETVADFIGAKSFEEIVFTRNTTESINIFARSWGRKFLKRNDVVVISEMEHHSNIIPWQILIKELGIRLKWVPVDESGELDMRTCQEIMTQNKGRVKLFSVTQVSNVLGTINPVKQLAELAHEAGAVFMVDAAQGVARQEINVDNLGIDVLAFSGHKMYAPTGIGVLYCNKGILEQMDVIEGGGGMVRRVNQSEFDLEGLPWRFEAGTPNIAGGIVLAEAIGFIKELGLKNIIRHEKNLMNYALKRLKELEELRIYGPQDYRKRLGAVSFSIPEIHPHDISSLVDEDGVAIRAGHHCAMPLHIKLKIPATARASFAVYNTKNDVDVLVESLKKARKKFA